MEIKNEYTLTGKIKLAWWLLRTKLINRNIRLLRFPIDLRGCKYIDFGNRLTTGIGCRLEAFSADGRPTLRFGQGVQINDYVHICSMQSVTIGDNVLLAGKIYISDNSHGSYKGDRNDSSPDEVPIQRKYLISPVEIQENVWIGEGVIIMPGVTIGKGSIIGACSVVTGDIPPDSIAVGSPAHVIKKYDRSIGRWIPVTLPATPVNHLE